MHLLVIVESIGGYHAARFDATDRLLRSKGDRLTAIQITPTTTDHPWGSVPLSFPTVTPSRPQEDLETLLEALQPDAVAIPGWGFWYSRRALQWCKSRRKPAILLSESKADDAPRHWIKERYKQFIFVRHFSSALVGSESHRLYLESLGMKRERILLGYDAVDNDFFERETSKIRMENQPYPTFSPRPYWLTVSRMIPRKNLSLLLDAYVGYRQEIGTSWAWDLAICGSGSEEAELISKRKRLQLESSIHFPGFKTYSEIPTWYAYAQALIHPALQEQWGLVVNEACASGLPILCSNHLGAKELVVEGMNGFQFDPRSVTSLINAMTKFHRISVEQRQQMGAQSRKIIQGYHPNRFAQGLDEAFQIARKTKTY